MRRRRFMGPFGSAAAPWPLRLRAQTPGRIAKIGHIASGTPASSPHLLVAFQQGLRKLGYVEGKNLLIERSYAEREGGDPPGLAKAIGVALPTTLLAGRTR